MKRKTILKSLTLAVGMMALIVELLINAHAQNIKQGVTDKLDRTVLPIPEPQPPTITELDARNVKPPARFQVTAPKGAPNVVIVLLDDIGFGQSSAFGGPIKMPTLDKLASDGLRYNGFHSTALCSPTRTALLTGRNHHVNNAGAILPSPAIPASAHRA
jgi:Sulfatase